MRSSAVRIWAAAATAILAAAAADAVAEFAANSGWLGARLADHDHESIVPALVIGAAVALSLLLAVLFSRVSSRDSLTPRLSDVAIAFCGSVLCVVAMEAYETHFGGTSPFDPRSVVVSHAPALIVAFLSIGALVRVALRAAIRAAAKASVSVAAFFEQSLSRRSGGAEPRLAARISAFELCVPHVPMWLACGCRGLRAPPPTISSNYHTA